MSPSIPYGIASLAGPVYHSLRTLEERDGQARRFLGGVALAEEAGTTCDRLYTAMFLMSATVATILEEAVDWDEVDGVFTYEYLEVSIAPPHDDGSLPAWLWQRLTPEWWGEFSESGVVNNERHQWLVHQIYLWGHTRGIVMLTPDFALEVDQLKYKYLPEHPTLSIALWRQAVEAGCTDGYWPWVKASLSQVA